MWAELGAASNLPVNDVMSGWTSRMGFPMVSADVISWDDDNLKVKLTQSKFSKTAGLIECEPWSIPLTILSSNGEEQKMIFNKSELEISLAGVKKESGWMKLNASFMNWHQVKYDSQLLSALTKNLTSLDTLDRLAIPYEVNTLASAGVVSIVEYLKVRLKDSHTS